MSEDVNSGRPAYYQYVTARQARRQAHVDALSRAARDAAPDPIAREHAGRAAVSAGVAEFDRREPAMTFAQWRAAS